MIIRPLIISDLSNVKKELVINASMLKERPPIPMLIQDVAAPAPIPVVPSSTPPTPRNAYAYISAQRFQSYQHQKENINEQIAASRYQLERILITLHN